MVEEKKVKKKVSIDKKIKHNPWILSTLLLAAMTLILIFTVLSGNVSQAKAGQVVLEVAQQQLGDSVTLSNVEEYEGDFYLVTLSYQGQESDILITKDGLNLIGGVTPISSLMEPEETPNPKPTTGDVVKADKPLVQLFVMTHCPYGTQAEKGFLPIMRLMENVADMEIRFVHYFMHEPEETETPRQVCIREEQGDKFLDYLECFLEGDGNAQNGYITNGNDPSFCMKEVGVDEELVQECIDSGRAEEYYEEDSALSQAAGVQGSPTLVVNGVISQSGRSEAAYLGQVCASTNEPSEELCTTPVSTATPGVYFGWDSTSNVGEGNVCG